MIKMSYIQEIYLTPKQQTLRAQVIELHKWKYDKIEKGEPRRRYDKWFEGKFCPFFYKYKDKFLNYIAYELLLRGINRMSGKTIPPISNKMIHVYCEIAQRNLDTARLVSENLNGTAWKNIQRISKKWIQLRDHQLLPDPTKKPWFYLSMSTGVISIRVTT